MASDELHTPLSIFLGTFNMNGCPLSPPHAKLWLEGDDGVRCVGEEALWNRQPHIDSVDISSYSASNADLVVLALQECPSCKEDTKDGCTLINGIQEALSPLHERIVDISMGEPCTYGIQQPATDSYGLPTFAEWYGYTRLIVYAKNTKKIDPHDEDSNPKSIMSCIPIYCPLGNKPSTFKIYPTNQSPDKGAVCVYMASLNLLLIAVHLHGTNQYGIPECVFDEIRKQQLRSITHTCREQIKKIIDHHNETDMRVIMLGDFNFRCERYSHPDDKSKAGRDFQYIYNVITSGEERTIRDLFWKYDRLQLLLKEERMNEFDTSPKLFLAPMMDMISITLLSLDNDEEQDHDNIRTFWKSSIKNPTMILPTFSFLKKDQSDVFQPRLYQDKRCPSWTDRILISSNNYFFSTIRSIGAQCVLDSSDHVPLYAFVELSHGKES